jgi:hypothetical protein
LSLALASLKRGDDWKFLAIALRASQILLDSEVPTLLAEHSSGRWAVGPVAIARC